MKFKALIFALLTTASSSIIASEPPQETKAKAEQFVTGSIDLETAQLMQSSIARHYARLAQHQPHSVALTQSTSPLFGRLESMSTKSTQKIKAKDNQEYLNQILGASAAIPQCKIDGTGQPIFFADIAPLELTVFNRHKISPDSLTKKATKKPKKDKEANSTSASAQKSSSNTPYIVGGVVAGGLLTCAAVKTYIWINQRQSTSGNQQ
jgi:hypothetical protein